MTLKIKLLLACIFFTYIVDSNAQEQLYHEKVSTLDNTINTLYAVISGEKGEKRNWKLFKYLFHPNAKLIAAKKNETGSFNATYLTPDDYINQFGSWLEANGFQENEIYREVSSFGNITHVFSTYSAFTSNENGKKPLTRGINSIQLLNDGNRWWVVNIYWTSESKNNRIPKKYLPTAISKRIQLQGAQNFRDLGGIIGANGNKISHKKLFRSGRLSRLTNSDIDSIKDLGIKQIIDLRTTTQRQQAPDKTIETVVNHHLPLLEGEVGSRAFMNKIMSKEIDGRTFMLETYETIDSLKIANWTRIFNLLEDNKPTLWHCSSGKDRAGMTTALVLASLGVDEKTIVKDFMASNDYLAASHTRTLTAFEARGGKEHKDLIRPLLIVEEAYIHTFLNAIKNKYGSLDKFLSVLDVDTKKMQENYLEH